MNKNILFLALLSVSFQQAQSQVPGNAIEVVIDSIISSYFEAGKFNGAVLVAADGERVYEKNWGYADLETGSALTSESQYYIASISKIFTSTAVLLLEKHGRLSLNDRITLYLPELPDCFRPVRIHQLLSHTAGVPEEPGGWRILVNTDNSDVMEFLRGVEELEFEPGTAYRYSNNGYVLLAQLIEGVSGKSYKDFLEHHVFKPAGMLQSFVVSRSMPITDLHVAKSYVKGQQADWPLYRVGPAGIYSTPGDLFAFDQAYFNHVYFDGKEMKRILTPVRVEDKAQHYGLGWGILDMEGERYLGHTGGTFGFRTLYEHQFGKNNTLIIFTNVGDLTPLMEIRNQLDQVLGGYQNDEGDSAANNN
jgi:CubicO group peptidase (beta-lactamase class C family)